MDKGGGGVKFSKSMKKGGGGGVVLKYSCNKGGKLLETVVSTLV